MKYLVPLFCFFTASFMAVSVSAQKKSNVFQPNIPALFKTNELLLVNRKANVVFDQNNVALHLDSKIFPGVAWFKNADFSTGTIEFDAKGSNRPQGSFVGFAFHREGAAYDAIYFRPFNFQAESNLSKQHAVQYISYPEYDWKKLRQTFPGKYENAISPSPDPDSWFHVKIVVSEKAIPVFVNNNQKSCLTVEKLNQRVSGGIGFWVGNGSEGDFANLKVVSDK